MCPRRSADTRVSLRTQHFHQQQLQLMFSHKQAAPAATGPTKLHLRQQQPCAPDASGRRPSERSSASRSPPTQYSRITHRWFCVSYLRRGRGWGVFTHKDAHGNGQGQQPEQAGKVGSGLMFQTRRQHGSSLLQLAAAQASQNSCLLVGISTCEAIRKTHQVWKRSRLGWLMLFSTLT